MSGTGTTSTAATTGLARRAARRHVVRRASHAGRA
jgi:hypothetical protein